MCMSVGCGKRLTRILSARCCIPSAAPVIACARRNDGLCVMTLVEKSTATSRRSWQMSWSAVRAAQRLGRTHAFRLAILYLTVFAASVLGVLLFIYWMSADFIERQTEATLDAEITGLAEQYAQRGISGLVQIVAARSAGDRGDSMLYLVTDSSGHPLAGNITNWPKGVAVRSGPLSFTTEVNVRGQTETHPARGMLIVIPEGYRLLVARDISDATAFRGHIKTTLIWSG